MCLNVPVHQLSGWVNGPAGPLGHPLLLPSMVSALPCAGTSQLPWVQPQLHRAAWGLLLLGVFSAAHH